MKKLLVLIVFGLLSSSNSFAQNKKRQENIETAAVVAGTAIATIIAINDMIEIIEQSGTEWVLANWDYEDGDILEVKLFEYNPKAYSDLSSTRSLIFKVKKNDEPSKLLVFVCSTNWWNDFGIIFSRVKAIIVTKALWEEIIFELLTTAVKQEKNNFEIFSKDSIVSLINVDGKKSLRVIRLDDLESIKNNKAIFSPKIGGWEYSKNAFFKSLNGDQHLVSRIDGTDLVIDFNEKRINLFNFQTKDLIKLNKLVVNNINNLFFNIEKTRRITRVSNTFSGIKNGDILYYGPPENLQKCKVLMKNIDLEQVQIVYTNSSGKLVSKWLEYYELYYKSKEGLYTPLVLD